MLSIGYFFDHSTVTASDAAGKVSLESVWVVAGTVPFAHVGGWGGYDTATADALDLIIDAAHHSGRAAGTACTLTSVVAPRRLKRMGHGVDTLASAYVGALEGDESVSNELIDEVLGAEQVAAPKSGGRRR